MSDHPSQQSNPLQAKVPEHLAIGSYATAMLALHSREEFVLDFIAAFASPSRVVARVILSPGHVKRLAAAVKENIEKYEKTCGPLPEPAKSEAVKPMPVQDVYSHLAIQDTIL